MKKIFEHIVEGQIYATRFDEIGKLIALEVREPLARTMQVEILNLQNGEILNTIECNWWSSVVALTPDYFILQEFVANASIPKPFGIQVIDIFTGKMLWELGGWTYIEKDIETLIAARQNGDGNAEMVTFQLKGGHKIENRVKKNDISHLKFPFKYEEESPYFLDLFQFLNRLLKIEPKKSIEYLEFKDLVIISYYIYHDKQFQNHLVVVNRQQEILLQLPLASSEGISNDTFVMIQNHLIVNHDKNHLTGYEC